jgi:hypothetical protein
MPEPEHHPVAKRARQTIVSPCREYRYCLWREWEPPQASYVVFIGLNPSTADATQDDPTLRRCVNYAKRWGYGAVCLLNLFAYRATRPAVMKAHPDPVGVENDYWLHYWASGADLIVAAWGNHGVHRQRDQAIFTRLNRPLFCLGITKTGQPKHPLYLNANVQPIPFNLF